MQGVDWSKRLGCLEDGSGQKLLQYPGSIPGRPVTYKLNNYSNLIWANPFNQFFKWKSVNTEANLKGNILHDLTHWGIRASIGAIFIVHSLKKFDPSWQEWLMSIGIPPEMQLPIALAEFIGGILLVVGVLTRITGAVFAVILLGAIFHIRWENGFFVSNYY